MNKIKWLFMSGREKLLYQIETAKANKQRLHLSNDIILDFTENWNSTSSGLHRYLDKEQRYLVTRRFPTGNRKIEVVKGNVFPEFTTAYMNLEVEPYKR